MKKKITIIIAIIGLILVGFFLKDNLKHKLKYSKIIKEIFAIILFFDGKHEFSKKIYRSDFNNYLLDKEFVKIKEINTNLEFVKTKDLDKIFIAEYYNIKHFGILHKSNIKNSKKLLIYFQGHGGTPHKFDYFNKIKSHYLNKGFDVFALAMSDKGFNKTGLSFPGHDEKIKNHSTFKNFFDPDNPQKKPLSLMLSGNFYLIKKLINNNKYENIYAVGISGGGWYTTFMSALIPEIEKSYSFAGTFPKMLSIFKINRGDWEQSKSQIYKKIDYWNLYKLSILDENYKKNRFHYQIYNKKDPCCFMSPYADMMYSAVNKINNINFKVILTDLDTHEIDNKFLFKDLK
jgi:hypothetical protein